MNPLVIFCDIDGVVADLGREWLAMVNAERNEPTDDVPTPSPAQ